MDELLNEGMSFSRIVEIATVQDSIDAVKAEEDKAMVKMFQALGKVK